MTRKRSVCFVCYTGLSFSIWFQQEFERYLHQNGAERVETFVDGFTGYKKAEKERRPVMESDVAVAMASNIARRLKSLGYRGTVVDFQRVKNFFGGDEERIWDYVYGLLPEP